MAVNDGYLAYVLDQLTPGVSPRRMFGGVGLYDADAHYFGLIDDDTLYFKVDDQTVAPYDEADMPPFQPGGPDGPAMKAYRQVPVAVLEDREAVRAWMADAVGVARRSPKKRRR